MKDDADNPASESATQMLPESPADPQPEPAFITRARRILTGDIRPDDYLEVTPEVRRRVKLSMDYAIARLNGQQPAPEVEPRQIRQETLSFHHGGDSVAYIEDERGIIILGVGPEQPTTLLEKIPSLVSGRVNFGVPVGDEIWA